MSVESPENWPCLLKRKKQKFKLLNREHHVYIDIDKLVSSSVTI